MFPITMMRRRYGRSLSNLPQVVGMANEALIYDISGPEPTLLLEIRSCAVAVKARELPTWTRELMEHRRPWFSQPSPYSPCD